MMQRGQCFINPTNGMQQEISLTPKVGNGTYGIMNAKRDNAQNESLEKWNKPKKERTECCITSTSLAQDNDEICDEIPTQDYKKMTIVQLREIIKGKGLKVKKFSKLKKKDLVALIEKS